MSININSKQDYSYLFSSLNNTKNSNDLLSSINLSDYNSIKSGSYGKLLKQYYKSTEADSADSASKEKVNSKTDNTEAKELKEVQTKANDLRDSVGNLMQRGSNSVFGSENMDKVYSAVSDMVDKYNSLIEAASETSSKNILKGTVGMIDLVKDYEDSLKEIGITIDKSDKLVIDKETFKSADVDKIEKLFRGNNSLSYLVSGRAVSIGNAAYNESNKSSIYTGDGSYAALTTGDIFNSII